MRKHLALKPALAALLGAAFCLQAHAADLLTLKHTAIGGSLAMYGLATWKSGNLKQCQLENTVGYEYGSNEEIHTKSLSYRFYNCEFDDSLRLPWGFKLRMLPTLLASQWSADSGPYASAANEVTFTPLGQFVVGVGSVNLDATFGIGYSYLTPTSIGNQVKSTNFQFSDQLSFGISDSKNRYRLSWFYRHISNLDIRTPNNGVDLVGASFSMRLD